MRSILPMKLAKTGSVILSLFICVLGLFLIFNPGFSPGILGNYAGAVMIAFGIVKIIGYFSKDLYRLAFQYDLAFGLLMITIGIMVILEPGNVIDSICVAIGISAIMDGFLKVQISIDSRVFGIKLWWLILISAIATVGVGIMLLFRTAESTRVLMLLLGFSMLAQGILNLLTTILTVKIIRHQYPDIIDADFE